MRIERRQRPDGAHPVYWASFRPEAPADWKVIPISEMAKTFKGKLPTRVLEAPTQKSRPYLLLDGLRGGTHVYTEETYLPSVTESDSVLIADGSKSGFTVRGVAGILGSTLLAFRAREGCNPSFLFHVLSSLFPYLNSATTGTAIPHLDQDLLLQLRLAVPPPCEQAAIAQLLDAVDKTIQTTRVATERARALDHSLLHELLEKGIAWRHGKRKPNWPIHRLDEVADVGSGVTLGKDVSGFKNVELPYLRVANVQDGHLDLSTIKTVRVRVEEVENYRLEPGDVLMTEGGDLDKLGRGTIWHGEIPNCLHQNHIFRVRAKQDQLRPYFFSLVVESDIAKRYFLRVAKRTTNLASINKTVLRAFRFPVPEPTEQEEIENVMKAVKATVKALSEKESALLTLKKSLMHDLLTGTVRVKANLFQVAEAV